MQAGSGKGASECNGFDESAAEGQHQGMYVVVLRSLPPPEPATVQALAAALGVLPYEARSKLVVLGGGPSVVAKLADGGRAQGLAAALSQAGFAPLVVDENAVRQAPVFEARRLSFDAGGLQVEERGGATRSVGFGAIAMVLRATGISTGSVTESTTRNTFSAGRALLTGGLMLTKKQTTFTTQATEEWQGLLMVYPAGGMPLRIDEGVLLEGPGPSQPTRQAAFAYIIEQLRSRCPQAVYDDRLMRRAGQLQLLGAGLPPEEHLELALAILAATLG